LSRHSDDEDDSGDDKSDDDESGTDNGTNINLNFSDEGVIGASEPLSSEVVEDSRVYGQEQFKNLPNTCSSPVIRSRVLKDAFHLMDQIKVPRRHGLAKDFSKKFRDALFLVDEVDKKKMLRSI
jgi:hypothetical protein